MRKPGPEARFSLYPSCPELYALFHVLHFRNEVMQQVLDAVLQGRRRGWATGARALHVQVNGALLISAECDVAAILRHCRAHTRLQKVLDCSNDFFVGLVVELAIGIMVETAGAIGCHYRLRRHEVLHDRAEDRRLQMLPVPISLGYGNKVEAEEDADDARNIEKSCCQRRRRAGAI